MEVEDALLRIKKILRHLSWTSGHKVRIHIWKAAIFIDATSGWTQFRWNSYNIRFIYPTPSTWDNKKWVHLETYVDAIKINPSRTNLEYSLQIVEVTLRDDVIFDDLEKCKTICKSVLYRLFSTPTLKSSSRQKQPPASWSGVVSL